MTTISVNTTTLLALLGAEAIAVLGMALFLYWAVRSVGLFHAAACGKEFAKTVAMARDIIQASVENAAIKISNNEARILELGREVNRLADRLKQVTPASIQTMVDDAASRKAVALTANQQRASQAAVKMAQELEDLLGALTSAPTALAAHVRKGLPAHLPPKLAGQIVAYCGTRGISVNATPLMPPVTTLKSGGRAFP